MIAAGGLDLGYPFILGVLATVNRAASCCCRPTSCTSSDSKGCAREPNGAAISRALIVAATVALGFFTVFLAIGLLYNAGVDWFVQQSDWISVGIGVLMVALGVADVVRVPPHDRHPEDRVGGKDRTVLSMFLYGISYAVASIGCTIGFFASAVLKNVDRKGFVNGVLGVVAYAVGMGVMLAALTRCPGHGPDRAAHRAAPFDDPPGSHRRCVPHHHRRLPELVLVDGDRQPAQWRRRPGRELAVEGGDVAPGTGAWWLFAVLGGVTLVAVSTCGGGRTSRPPMIRPRPPRSPPRRTTRLRESLRLRPRP